MTQMTQSGEGLMSKTSAPIDGAQARGDAGASDVFAVMATRRSIKRFTPRPVEMDKIMQIIQAGHLAPSSGNLQNWTFTIISDVDKIRAMYHHTLDQEAFLSATAAIIVCGDVDHSHTMYGMRGKRLYTIQNCAAAIQNMLLAAHAIGLGALWVGAFDEDKISSMFGIPSHQHRPQAIILLGYPGEQPEPKDKKPLASVVFFNEFGNKVLRPHLIFYDWATEWRMQGQKVRGHVSNMRSSIVPQSWLQNAKNDGSEAKRESSEQASIVPIDGDDGQAEHTSAQTPGSFPGLHRRHRKTSLGGFSFDVSKEKLREAIDKLKREGYREK